MLRPIKDCNSQDANPSDLDSHIIFRVPGKDLAWQFPVAVLWVPGGDAGAGGSGGCESKLSNPQNGWV